ncbi:MAG: hypothetical protein J7L23_00810 [Candidatus Diapherotrites archaeon]|nr:hypothetical protein [Candidatus Diapherotrites archaeon]
MKRVLAGNVYIEIPDDSKLYDLRGDYVFRTVSKKEKMKSRIKLTLIFIFLVSFGSLVVYNSIAHGSKLLSNEGLQIVFWLLLLSILIIVFPWTLTVGIENDWRVIKRLIRIARDFGGTVYVYKKKSSLRDRIKGKDESVNILTGRIDNYNILCRLPCRISYGELMDIYETSILVTKYEEDEEPDGDFLIHMKPKPLIESFIKKPSGFNEAKTGDAKFDSRVLVLTNDEVKCKGYLDSRTRRTILPLVNRSFKLKLTDRGIGKYTVISAGKPKPEEVERDIKSLVELVKGMDKTGIGNFSSLP